MGLSAALTAEAGWVVGGTAVVEVVFGLPGLGTFLVDSIAMRDYFVLQAYIVVAAAWDAGDRLRRGGCASPA